MSEQRCNCNKCDAGSVIVVTVYVCRQGNSHWNFDIVAGHGKVTKSRGSRRVFDDGEQLSTKLIVASIEILRRKADQASQQKFRARTVLTGLRRLSVQKGGVNKAMEHLR